MEETRIVFSPVRSGTFWSAPKLNRRLLVLTASIMLIAACVQDDAATTETANSPTTPGMTTKASPVTIMHVGDGLTQGGRDHSTYRCFLDEMLHELGVPFDFVGSRQKPRDGYDYTCPTDFDQDHEAWMGARLGGFETDKMAASVEELQPDVTLIYLGGFDIWREADPSDVAGRLTSFIARLQAANPDITLLVASMIPCVTPLPWCTEGYPAYSDAIAGFGGLSTDESTVLVVDMATGMDTDLLRSNNLSFTDAGDEAMAGRWMAALVESGAISTDR